jgi:hypothetical protein
VTRAVPGSGREIHDKRYLRRLGYPFEDLAPLDVGGILPFACALFAIDVMGLVVDHDEIAPAAEHPADGGVRVLLRPAAHGPEHCSGNKPPFFGDILGDPVVALPLERNALPVTDNDVWVELVVVLGRHRFEGIVEIVLAGGVKPIAARHAAHAVAHSEIRNQREEVRRERRTAHLAPVQRRPGDEESHHHSLTRTSRELQCVADEGGRLGHLAPLLYLVQVDDGLDRLLLAKEEAPAKRPALLIALEPPFEKPPRHERRARLAGQAPCANFVAQLIDEIIELLARGEHVLEESRLLAGDAGDPALHILCRGEEAYRGPPPLDKP